MLGHAMQTGWIVGIGHGSDVCNYREPAGTGLCIATVGVLLPPERLGSSLKRCTSSASSRLWKRAAVMRGVITCSLLIRASVVPTGRPCLPHQR